MEPAWSEVVAGVVSRCKCHNFGWRTVERGGRDYRFIDLIFPSRSGGRESLPRLFGKRTNEGTPVSTEVVALESMLLKKERGLTCRMFFPRKEHALPPCFKRSNSGRSSGTSDGRQGRGMGAQRSGIRRSWSELEGMKRRTYWELGWSKIYWEKNGRENFLRLINWIFL